MAADEAEAAEASAVHVETLVQEKCIKRPVTNVRKNAKFHSNLQKASRFIAKIATLSIRNTNSFCAIGQ